MGGPGFLSLPIRGRRNKMQHIPVPKEFQTASGEADKFFFGKTKNRGAGFQNFNPIVPRGRDRFGRTYVPSQEGLGGSWQFVTGTGRDLAPDGPAESSARGINVDLRTDPETSTDRQSNPAPQGGTGITSGSSGGRPAPTLLDDPNQQITILGE